MKRKKGRNDDKRSRAYNRIKLKLLSNESNLWAVPF